MLTLPVLWAVKGPGAVPESAAPLRRLPCSDWSPPSGLRQAPSPPGGSFLPPSLLLWLRSVKRQGRNG